MTYCTTHGEYSTTDSVCPQCRISRTSWTDFVPRFPAFSAKNVGPQHLDTLPCKEIIESKPAAEVPSTESAPPAPREWWLMPQGLFAYDYEPPAYRNAVKVVEASAYEKLRADLKYAYSEISTKNIQINQMAGEIAALQNQFRDAKTPKTPKS